MKFSYQHCYPFLLNVHPKPATLQLDESSIILDMPDDTATGLSLSTFFDESVDDLQEDCYVVHGKECDICGCDEKADPSDIVNQASSISSKAVVQTKTFPSPHIFHKLCLYVWLHTKLHKDEDATCPMCRTKFILSAHSKELHTYLELPQSLVERCNTVIEESLLQMNRIADKIKQAKQEEDDSTDDIRKLELSNIRRALTTAQRAATTTNDLAQHDLAQCSGAMRRIAAIIAMSD
jgi:hypothetical protein